MIQGHCHGKVVGTLQTWPAKAGGRSPKGPAVAGTTVYINYNIIVRRPSLRLNKAASTIVTEIIIT